MQGLLLGTEAPTMTPNGIDFSFFLLFLLYGEETDLVLSGVFDAI